MFHWGFVPPERLKTTALATPKGPVLPMNLLIISDDSYFLCFMPLIVIMHLVI